MGALTELVGKARRGNADSRQELEEHLRPLVHGVLLGWLPHALAGLQVRGLISDAFAAIIGDDAKFIPTLLARVRTAGQSMQRQRPDATDPPSPDASIREALGILARLRKLPERERERLALRLIEGVPGPEICEALGANDLEVGADLERGLGLLQEGPGAQVVALKNDPYLWSLTGSPHPVVVRLENLLTPLRYDDSAVAAEPEVATNPIGVAAAERTPVSDPGPVPAAIEGRRGTSEFKPPVPSIPDPRRSGPGLKPGGLPPLAPPAGVDPKKSGSNLPTALGPDQRKSSGNLGVFAGAHPRKSNANLGAMAGADPRKSGGNLGLVPPSAGGEPRKTGPTMKGLDGGVTSGRPERNPEPTDPPSNAFVLPPDLDDDDGDERTEALMPIPGRANPFELQPRTVAAPDLPAAAQVNPYAGMPGTIAANDLPAAARVAPGAAAATVPVSAGKRPTGTQMPQQPGPPSEVPAVRPTAAAPPTGTSAPTPAQHEMEEMTGLVAPRALLAARAAAAAPPLGGHAPGTDQTGEAQALGEGRENPTRVQPIKPPVHWKSVLFAEDDDEVSITLPVPERNRMLRKKGVWRGQAPFMIAGMMATVGIALAWVTIASSERRATRMWNLVEVSVAATDLSEGTVVTMDKISKRAIPEPFVTASVVKPDGYGYVINQKLLVPVQAGDPLLWSHFEMAQTTERLSKRVNKRARAVSVLTGRVTAVGGWVRPGDWVDVIVSLKDGPKGTSRAAVTLMQDVPVIATGKISEKTNYGILGQSQREYQHVSLMLLPEEAEMVTLAKDIGSFRLTLRNEGDHDVHRDGYGSNARTLLDGARVKLLQMKRLATIQSIRDAPLEHAAPPAPMRLRIEPVQ